MYNVRANLYLFPVTLCTLVHETAANPPQFACMLETDGLSSDWWLHGTSMMLTFQD